MTSASEWLLSVAGLARRLNAEAMGECAARTGLGGPEMDPSRSVSALRAPSLPQETTREPVVSLNKRAGRNS